MEYASGQGRASYIPTGIGRWNWGAFFLGWIWALGNTSCLIAIVTFVLYLVTFVNIVWWIVLCIKGSQWAWQSKYWNSVEHFQRVQRRWAWAGLIVTVSSIGLTVAAFMYLSGALNSPGSGPLSALLTDSAPVPRGYTRYRSATSPYSVGYPNGWRVRGGTDANGFPADIFVLRKGQLGGVEVTVTVGSSPNHAPNSKAFLDQALRSTKKAGGTEVRRAGKAVVEGESAYLFSYTKQGKGSAAADRYTSAVWVAKGRAWSATLATDRSNHSRQTATLKKMLSSFRYSLR